LFYNFFQLCATLKTFQKSFILHCFRSSLKFLIEEQTKWCSILCGRNHTGVMRIQSFQNILGTSDVSSLILF